MTVITILSVAWDVTCRGWLGSMMVLWCYWWLGGTTYLVWLFGYCDVISIHCNVSSVHWDVAFSMFFTTLLRWIDVPLSWCSCTRVFIPWFYVDLILPSVGVLFSDLVCCFSLSVSWVSWATIYQHGAIQYSITHPLKLYRVCPNFIAHLLEKYHATLSSITPPHKNYCMIPLMHHTPLREVSPNPWKCCPPSLGMSCDTF